MFDFATNSPLCWNSHEQQLTQSLLKHLSWKVESPPQLCQEAKHLGLQDQDLFSTKLIGKSHHEVTDMGVTNSQDQCISSESDGSYGKHAEGQMKPVFFMRHPDFVTSPSQIDPSESINRILYPYANPFTGGLFTAYERPAIIQQQMIGMTSARVPLPLDLAEDGPIYVNAKQYHAILRRRQTRAKLEAQNKIVKARKPYLHESRHQHALNRVRGSGGRFLSTKRVQQGPTPATDSRCVPKSIHSCRIGYVSEFESRQPETSKSTAASLPSSSSVIASVSNNSDVIFQQPDHRFSALSSHPGLTCNATQHRARVVQREVESGRPWCDRV